ncbi:TetR/AcrR family transcriptional regulator [Nonomuraea sp. NPDC050547]|uniref:TetR/AcrR family transcriptional regulator n=1 Tax=Nonomuraea sp. NPDC050547 TaxID=3364368 RepID=UPI0037ABB6B1
MNAEAPRRLRADAARNVERIIAAAREVFAEQGAEAQLDDIARRAGVGQATLYRHFASKEDLILTIVRRRFDEDVEPAMHRALADPDPWAGIVLLLETVLEVAAGERATFAAARGPAAFLGLASQYFDSLTVLLGRAQEAGLVRADLSGEDVPRLFTMLIAVQRLGSDPGDLLIGARSLGSEPNEGWRRYLVLLLDALRPAAATPLPPLTTRTMLTTRKSPR